MVDLISFSFNSLDEWKGNCRFEKCYYLDLSMLNSVCILESSLVSQVSCKLIGCLSSIFKLLLGYEV